MITDVIETDFNEEAWVLSMLFFFNIDFHSEVQCSAYETKQEVVRSKGKRGRGEDEVAITRQC